MLKLKKTSIVMLLALTLSACNGESDEPSGSTPEDPVIVDPSDPVTDPDTPVTTPDDDDDTPVTTPGDDDDTPVTTPDDDDDTPVTTPDDDDDTPVTTPDDDDDTPVTTPDDDDDTPVTTPDEEDPVVVIPPEENDSELPVDPESGVVNTGVSLPYNLPVNPLSPLNPIVNRRLVVVDTSKTGITNQYTDNANGVLLYSKYKLEDSETTVDVYTDDNYIDGNFDIYNVDENLSSDYFTTAAKEVHDSLRDRIIPYLGIYSDLNSYVRNQQAGSNAINCMIAIDYENHINSGDSLDILTTAEASEITAAQALLTTPSQISPMVINKVMRLSVMGDDSRKISITNSAILKNFLYSNHFNDAESNDNLETICKGNSGEYNIYMNSLTKIYNTKVKMLEVEISKSEETTKSYMSHIALTGFDLDDSANNKVTIDIIDNVIIKNMFLNKIFNWNGDAFSYLSKHSFFNGEFTGLFEGFAIHHAGQNFSTRDTVSTCNPASLSSSCTYPQVYGDYGLMVSYLLSGEDSSAMTAKENIFLDFIDLLTDYDANGCGIEWSEVNNDQVEMSNACIEIAFDAAGFTELDGSPLTWSNLSTNWFAIKNEYSSSPSFTSSNNVREILTFE